MTDPRVEEQVQNYFSIGLILIYLTKTTKVSDRYKPKVIELLRSHIDFALGCS